MIRPRPPLSEMRAGPVETRGFAWPSVDTYPTLVGHPAVYYEFRLEREVAKDNHSVWNVVVQWTSKDPFYVVDRSGAVLVPTENAQFDVEDWSTHYWKQLAPAQQDLLLKGVLEGEEIPDFPPLEHTVTGPLQPRFRVYERAIYIGAPLDVSGEFEKTPEPTLISKPGLDQFLTENRSKNGDLRNLENVLLAYRGSGMTVREARDHSIIGADLAKSQQGTRSSVDVPCFGRLASKIGIRDLFEVAPPSETSFTPPYNLVGTVAMIAGVLIGLPALQTEISKPGLIADAYTKLCEAIGQPIVASEPKFKIARRPQPKLNETTQASVVKVKAPPLPSQIGAQVLTNDQIDKWQIPAGTIRWPIVGDTFVAVLRPPSLKADAIIPYRALPNNAGFSFLQNRWLGLTEAADPSGLVPFAVWDLESNRVVGRIFDRYLIGATVLSAERALTLSQQPSQPAVLRVWDLKAVKVLTEIPLPAGLVGPFELRSDKALVLIGQTIQGSTDPVYDGYLWELAKPAVSKVSLEITNPNLHISPSGKWISIASGPKIVVIDPATSHAQLVIVPSAKPNTKNEALGFTADDRLLILQDRMNVFAAGAFDTKRTIEMLAPLSDDLVLITDDLQAAVTRTADTKAMSLRNLLDPSKTKSICTSDCYNGVALNRASLSPDGRWLYVPVKAGRFEITLREASGGSVYSPDYEIGTKIAAYGETPPSASLEDCLTYAVGCFKTGTAALAAKEYGRAYAYLYGACRGGQFDACAEIVRSANALKIDSAQADTFAEFGCRFQHAGSCALRAPIQAMPASPPQAPAN